MNLQIPDGFQLAHIDIVTTDYEVHEVAAVCKDGVLAIHSNHLEAGENEFFNVTHVPTGTSLVIDVIYDHALDAIRDFETALPLSAPTWRVTRAPEHRQAAKVLRSFIVDVIHKYY